MPTYKPFRTVSDYDVLNLFAYSGSIPAVKGTFVKIQAGSSGSMVGLSPLSQYGSVGASWPNTVSKNWENPSKVVVASSGDAAVGMLFWDVRETDENGENLRFYPVKLAEMQAVLSGQTVPIVTKGIFDYSGVVGNPTPGSPAYTNDNGTIGTVSYGSTSQVGKFLSVKNSAGFVRLKLDL